MKTFVSHDGVDGNGVRAEVYVQTGEGVVKEIKENANGTADVHFTVENLKFPVHGWIGQDNPVYEVVKKAQQTGDKVEFRIEAQRKANIERDTPIADLRADMKIAREKTIAILASINGIVSDEAVTNPQEDPASTYGRIKAKGDEKKTVATPGTAFVAGSALQTLRDVTAEQSVSSDIIAAIAAQAILSGSTTDEVLSAIAGPDRRDDSQPELRKAFSVEGPSWKAFNSDGRQNLGASSITSGVGAEQFVRAELTKKVSPELSNSEKFNDAVKYFATLILSISDKIQAATYGSGFRADRGVASHARVRGIVYDTVTDYFTLPIETDVMVNPDKLNEWVTNVGRLSYNRFKLSIEIANSDLKVDEVLIPESLLNGAVPTFKTEPAPAVEVEVKEAEKSTEPVLEAIVEPVTEESETVTEVVVEAKAEKPKKEKVESVVESEVEEESPALAAVATDDNYEVLPQMHLDEAILVGGKLPDDVAATEETIEMFKEFVAETGLPKSDLAKVAKLLAWTFGPKFGKAQNIPDDALTDFIDFYVSMGGENFVKAVTGIAAK